jgi:DNA gyrase subunit A
MDADGAIRLSDEQARAILDLRLQRLTGLGRDEIGNEARGLKEKIEDLLDFLGSRGRIMATIRDELTSIRTQFAVPRRSEFIEADTDLDDEAFIEREDMVVTVTHGGYVKRTPLSLYRTQKRGGKGRAGMATKDEDFVTRLFSADTHTEVLFFSSTGMVYKQKVWRLPLGPPQARGKALVNILPLEAGETITSIMPLPESEDERARLDVMFVTRAAGVRRNRLSDFVQVNRNGKIAMKLEDAGDSIVDVQICSEVDDVLLTTALGACIRFSVDEVRVFTGRTSTGVRGLRLEEGDEVISLAVLRHIEVTSEEARAYLRHANAMRRAQDGAEASDEGVVADANGPETEDGADGPAREVSLSPERIAALGAAEQFILTVTHDGFGKRASAYDYRVTGRGGKGLLAHRLTTGQRLVASFPVEESDELMLVTDGGQLIRCPVGEIRIAARTTQGVRLIRTSDAEKVVSAERLAEQGADSPL